MRMCVYIYLHTHMHMHIYEVFLQKIGGYLGHLKIVIFFRKV